MSDVVTRHGTTVFDAGASATPTSVIGSQLTRITSDYRAAGPIAVIGHITTRYRHQNRHRRRPTWRSPAWIRLILTAKRKTTGRLRTALSGQTITLSPETAAVASRQAEEQTTRRRRRLMDRGRGSRGRGISSVTWYRTRSILISGKRTWRRW